MVLRQKNTETIIQCPKHHENRHFIVNRLEIEVGKAERNRQPDDDKIVAQMKFNPFPVVPKRQRRGRWNEGHHDIKADMLANMGMR